MDRKFYYDTVTQLEKMPTTAEYMQGWEGGYLGNPMREETRLTPDYEAGYADGKAGKTTNAGNWLKP
jgi:hypothetical protein